jgi:predicted Zn-dependent protease
VKYPIIEDTYLPKFLCSLTVIILCVALFTVFTSHNGKPLGIYDNGIGDKWSVGQRNLTIVDRTGSASWHLAILQAVATWTAGGTQLRFTVVTEPGPCQQQKEHIEYCQETGAQIARGGSDGDQGLFVPWVTNHHTYKSAILLVCSDCNLTSDRQVIVTTHEMGHALGLAHNPDPFSVMYYAGGSPEPNAGDYFALRNLEGVSGPITGEEAP